MLVECCLRVPIPLERPRSSPACLRLLASCSHTAVANTEGGLALRCSVDAIMCNLEPGCNWCVSAWVLCAVVWCCDVYVSAKEECRTIGSNNGDFVGLQHRHPLRKFCKLLPTFSRSAILRASATTSTPENVSANKCQISRIWHLNSKLWIRTVPIRHRTVHHFNWY